jgi:hypothetical protein
MKAFKPISRRLAIILALVSLWLLGAIGVFWEMHSTNWLFIGLHGHDATTIKEIGLFFSAWAAAQFPATYVAGGIIGLSDSCHPIRTTLWTVGAYQIVFSVVRAFHWPWWSVQGLDQFVPIIAYVMSVLLLLGNSVFSAWIMVMYRWVTARYFTH